MAQSNNIIEFPPTPFEFEVADSADSERLEYWDERGNMYSHPLPDLRRTEDWKAIVDEFGLKPHLAARAWFVVYAAHLEAVERNGVALLPEELDR
ncbi:hypothetical protein [Ruegeria arenilitoris]|uniref:hypothetical protein n=1 Tax=Ruegeria arenilitoris TaxID=1173585 RepID=UPI0014815467|nr:hypothetical protein [Ruegeria arenilitoris]